MAEVEGQGRSEARSRRSERVRFSVIVPSFNSRETIASCLEALLHQSVPPGEYEIIVVDDGSTDGTEEIVRGYDVTYLPQPHRGPAAARNLGVAQAGGDIVLLTDADCVPAADWIEKMSLPFEDDEIVGVKGVYRTRQQELMARFIQLEYEDKYKRMRKHRFIDFIDTYSAGYRRDVLLTNDGFDSGFPGASVEDQELSFRLAKRGYKMVFQPEAVVYHHHAADLTSYIRKKFRIGYWKVRVHVRHPQKIVNDSHTPQVLKIQVGLMPVLIATLLLSIGGMLPWGAFGTALAVFGLTALPFCIRVAVRDRAVGILSPLLLLARAGALAAGLAVGVISRAWSTEGHARCTWVVKRGLDIIGSIVGLILLAPLMALIACLIKLNSPGPIFFVQERVGEGGGLFKMYKFRSMIVGSEAMANEIHEFSHLPPPLLKIRDDPRVTRVGRWLRRFSLDELPQLFNVLKGEMSLVGPRPEETHIVQVYEDRHRKRLAVKPGITGPMQINGRGDLSLDERVKLELAYIEEHSLWTDILILMKTVPVVLLGKGAY
jgi:lipopolysaccharide/colanic/teichoic acid biosynthesis glycosyltransferase/glycosyltransferase involved in cell wall biosynthesis